MYKKILVPLDGSKLAEEALPHAKDLAHQSDGQVTLLTVVQSIVPMVTPDMVSIDTGPIIARMKEQAEQYLAHLTQKIGEEAKIKAVVLEDTTIADAIVSYADSANIDLIVMSTHGRSGISRWMYGSVADRVLRAAHCPVLLIRSQEA